MCDEFDLLLDVKSDIIRNMKLPERIAELEGMKSSGAISQQEFDVLVSLAQTQTSESAGPSAVVLEQNNSIQAQAEPKKSSSTFSIKKGLIVSAALVILVLAFKSTQQSEPKDSKEYKELLQKKTELLAKKTELESKTGDADLLQYDVDDLTSRVERWKQRINDVNSLGIAG